MKGGKEEEEKKMGPMFPRLHVNDADKGGPRAPPRNKMALYEQLSVPWHRFGFAAAGSLPIRPSHATSSIQGCGYDGSVFPLFITPTCSNSVKKVSSNSSGGMNHNGNRIKTKRKSVEQLKHRSSSTTGSAVQCSSISPCDDDDDFRVPTFVLTGNTTCANKDAPVLEAQKGSPSVNKAQENGCSATFSVSAHITKTHDKPTEKGKATNINPSKMERGHSKTKSKEASVIMEHKMSESFLGTKESLVGSSHSRNVSLEQVLSENKNVNGPSFSASLNNNHRSSKMVDRHSQEINDEPSGSPELGDAERNDEASDASMVDSVPGTTVSPDDVVAMIGPKHFWKARRAMVNQQRVFAIQVFELHRLIEVQKLIAASPHILLQHKPFLNKTVEKIPIKAPRNESISKPQPTDPGETDDFQKPTQSTDFPAERAVAAPPWRHEDESHREDIVQNLSLTPMAHDQKQSAWCFPLAANQWLVPVMSPSEGLIYKPYNGPCPPGGFMAPIYNGSGPPSFRPSSGDFMNSSCGIPMGPNYFPTPYHVPVMNTMYSVSVIEQTRSHGLTEQSSCNMSNVGGEIFSGRILKVQASKESELQGSSASSPCEKEQNGRDALPLFPRALAGSGNETRVIKVVPRSASSAPELAARIFWSIQEERQQHDS